MFIWDQKKSDVILFYEKMLKYFIVFDKHGKGLSEYLLSIFVTMVKNQTSYTWTENNLAHFL